MDYFDTQISLEVKYNKNQLVKRITKEIVDSTDINFKAILKQLMINEELGIALLAQIAIHKRADLPTLIGTVRYLGIPSQSVAIVLKIMVEHDLMNYIIEDKMFVVVYELSSDVQKEIDTYQYPLPMIIKPEPVKKNTDSGYVTIRRSLILKGNYHNEDICLDHINRCNNVALSLNNEVVAKVRQSWRSFITKKDNETHREYVQRYKAFQKYADTSIEVFSILNQHDNKFYLTHDYDKRGRTYCAGYHVNYQGTTENKASVEFFNKEIVE